MSEERLNDLLLAWQDQQLQGRDLQAAELCRDCPELAVELNQRIHVLRETNCLMQTDGAPSGPGDAGVVFEAVTSNWQTDPASDRTAATRPLAGATRTVSAPLARSIPGYEILEELGRGGMGVVYKARQHNLNRTVALKMILAGGHASSEATARFLQEAETIARLTHPNVVQVYEFGSHERKPYFSLEYLEGGSLAARLNGEPQPPLQAARMVETLAQAVQAAHEQRIVHRDLKPANVLLTADGIPKITDFGLAKQGDAGMTASGEVLGTPSYMAPEQAEGKTHEIGPAADIYALGAILYELLTGRPPFKGASTLDTLQMVIGAEPVPPSRLQARVPRDLETICLKCLDKRPLRRYASAGALAEDLRRYQTKEPILARPVGSLERSWRWCRRNPVVAGLSTLLLLVLVAGLAAVTHLWLRAETERTRAVDESTRAEALAARARKQRTVAEAQKTIAEVQSKRARAEAAKASKIAQVLTQMFEASDPLGLNGIPLLRPKAGESLTARNLLDRGAERIARELTGEPEVQAKLMDTIGNVYCTLGLTDKAGPLLERALELRRHALPKDHPDVAATLHNLAWLHHQKGNYTQARKLYHEALAIRRRHARAQPLPLNSTLLNLAWLLADMEDFAPAEKLFKEVIELRRRQQGEGHRDVAVARMGLTGMYIAQGNFAAAIQPYTLARKTFLKVEGGKGLVESIDLLQRGVMARELPSHLGPFLAMAGEKESEKYLQGSLKLARQALGNDHGYVALVLHELAHTQTLDRKYDEAEQNYRESLRIARRYGLEHPKTTLLIRNFCFFLKDRGKPAQAKQLLQEAVSVRRQRCGPKHHLLADVLLLSAELMDLANRSGRERLLHEAAGIYRQSPDASRRHRATCLNFLGVCVSLTRPAEAERLFGEALPLARQQFGSKDPFVALLLCNLATVRMNQNNYKEVMPLLEESLAIYRKGSPADVATGRNTWRCLGRLYLCTGQPAKAAEAALERRKLAGTQANELYEVACELARCAAAFKEGATEHGKYADLAMETLLRARARGFKNARLLRTDKTFDPLRTRPDFKKLLQELEGPKSE